MNNPQNHQWTWQQKICREIFETKYNLHKERGVEEVFENIAREIASAEKPEKRKEVEALFFRELISGRFIPAGRILANARPFSEIKNYNNCFTIDLEDSMESIYDSLKEDAIISKMGGGVGFDASKLRPKGAPLSGGGTSSGVISFLRIFDQSAKTIVTGGQRRSAHIALLDISHPDIESFITVKQGDENKELTQFNISVKISDAFMQAVEEDKDWNLTFEGKVYKTLKARDLYDLLARNAFRHNEPGIFCQDTVERFNNGWWAFKMDRVNPCGELVMPPYSLCCLGAVNLTRFVIDPFGPRRNFDFSGFADSVGVGIRFLDDVLDATVYPLERIKTFSRAWRRIGLGFTGLGDLLAMLKIPYGSPESLGWAEKIGRALRDASYQASSNLAAEKGSFPAFDRDKFLQARFVKTLPEDIRESIARRGMRNIQLNTIAPTGTTSLSLGQNCSSGIEPIFALEYNRSIRTGRDDETVTEKVFDYGWLLYRQLREQGKIEAPPDGDGVPEFWTTTRDIDPYASIELQAVFQQYIDHSISKTLNLPPGTSFETYKNLFRFAYQKGLKGFTTFNPDGSLKGILEYRDEEKIPRRFAPRRPTELPCDIHKIRQGEGFFIILAGIYHGSLYELFMLPDPGGSLAEALPERGRVRKSEGRRYDLLPEAEAGEEVLLKDFTRIYASPNASLGRLLSMSLRHGTPLQFVVDQLSKDNHFLDFERAVSRVLKSYIQDGEEVVTSGNRCSECGGVLVFRDGCMACRDCGFSKCN
ncbi:MAG: adenosylcobalamin-dependent ribonucleoside-diphosphate reductase [Spirochaetales bacterium]|jgi:ribonucleoside-diphosphate reductase alpha chain|nr:adenosylcobalamin-dependent ribonucleoside-diphosphate reductase [Spirochaetales bacterium]